MKKFACLLLLSMLILSISACDKTENTVAVSEEITSYIPPHPGLHQFHTGSSFADLNVYEETDYSNIVAYSDVNTYSADNAVVEYSIKNNNMNTGFWIYNRSNVEFYNGTEWVTLPYYGDGSEDESGWLFCMAVNDDGCVETGCKKDLNKIVAAEIVPGDYRMVSFLADRSLHFYFEIK